MKLVGDVSAVILTAFLCIAVPLPLAAELVQHHYVLAESEGTASDCLSCHDPSLAGDAKYCTTKCGIIKSHSIEKEYPPAENRELYASLAEVTARGIKLIDGKLSCISCHNLKNPGRFHLAADGRELCIICHVGYYK